MTAAAPSAAANPILADANTIAHEAEYQSLFAALDTNNNGDISKSRLLKAIAAAGLRKDDQRLALTMKFLKRFRAKDRLSFSDFVQAVYPAEQLIGRCLRRELVIQDWAEFTEKLGTIFESVRTDRGGKVADYIPQLARVDPERFGLAVCTVNGQRFEAGNSRVDFCVQSTCKPILYLLALQEHGADAVHQYVGREPSGVRFNALALNEVGLPHNPLINSGAIMTSSLIKPSLPMAQRFAHVKDIWARMSGYSDVGYSNTVYLSERATADRNFALAYFMHGENAFPKGTDLIRTLELYFQSCSIEMTCDSMSVVAATLANGGVCPITNERVAQSEDVRHVLSLMYSCGMYDFSGEFAFIVGLPAKSGVSGAIMLVVPNVMGVCVWSPRLDAIGNSQRGLSFCKKLVKQFDFHPYSGLGAEDRATLSQEMQSFETIARLLHAAGAGDIEMVRVLMARNANLSMCDYDRRTALHVAASEGHADVVRFLVLHGCPLKPVDRWGNTPLDDAKREGHTEVLEVLKAAIEAADAGKDGAAP